jgi:hypothetical protein
MAWLFVVLVVVARVALGVVGFRQAKSRQLQTRFGPEYDRLVEEEGDRKRAEAELTDMAKRRDALELNELDPDAARAYAEQWRTVQERFIDDPRQTVAEADALVQQVMRDRGYPVDEFDERVEMVTVDHPGLADNYRTAHAVQVRSEQDEATTDDLRDAFQLYRELFAELLTDAEAEHEIPEKGER